jgi:hypothetical protein
VAEALKMADIWRIFSFLREGTGNEQITKNGKYGIFEVLQAFSVKKSQKKRTRTHPPAFLYIQARINARQNKRRKHEKTNRGG